MTQTNEIPPEGWDRFFDDLNRNYRNWRLTLELLSGDYGDQPAIEGMPLQGFTHERQGTAAGDILIEAGDSPDSYFVHRIIHPTRVLAADTLPGEETDLEIESADTPDRILVHLRQNPDLPPS